jgi:hypothetical protein
MSNGTAPINKKISVMPTITIVDDNTFIPVVKGNPTFNNYKIKPDDLLTDIKQRISDLESIITGITRDISYIEEDLDIESVGNFFATGLDFSTGNTWYYTLSTCIKMLPFNYTDESLGMVWMTGGRIAKNLFKDHTMVWIEEGQAIQDYDRTMWNRLFIDHFDSVNKVVYVKWWPKLPVLTE